MRLAILPFGHTPPVTACERSNGSSEHNSSSTPTNPGPPLHMPGALHLPPQTPPQSHQLARPAGAIGAGRATAEFVRAASRLPPPARVRSQRPGIVAARRKMPPPLIAHQRFQRAHLVYISPQRGVI